MKYYVRYTNMDTKRSAFVDESFDSPEDAAEEIRQQILEDFGYKELYLYELLDDDDLFDEGIEIEWQYIN